MNFENINQTTAEIGERARKLWLAGLGAVARTRAGGARIFSELVTEGSAFERKTRKEVEAAVARWRKQAGGNMNAVRNQTSDQLKRLEKAFEDRVATVLARLDVPTRDSIDKLARQVERLSKEVRAFEAARTSRS